MTARRRFSAAIGSIALIGGLLAITTLNASADSVKLSGCLIKGEGDDGYLLINTPMEPGATPAEGRSVTPGTLGTTPVFANVFYWLDKDDDLRAHIGHRVEVEGELKGDLKSGEIEIDRKDQWTELEVKSNGREMKARVPNASVVAAPNADRKISVLVRRLDVDKVRMLDAVCR
jgi:hypothetical protein